MTKGACKYMKLSGTPKNATAMVRIARLTSTATMIVSGPTHDSLWIAKPSLDVGRVVVDVISFSFQTYIMLVDGKVYCRKKSHALGQENGATSTTMSQERFVDTCMSKRRKSACSVGDKLATVCASSCFHTSRTGCSSARPRSVR